MLKIEEIEQFIKDDESSDKKSFARKGQMYYEGQHEILNYKIYYIDADGKPQEDKFRSNIRISHPFFTELVDQQVQYMLSGEDGIIQSDIPELQEHLDLYFDDDFYSEVYELLTGCISKGFEYMYAYKNSEGRTAFQCADSIGVVEVRAKDTDDKCEYMIYWYIDRVEKGHKKIKRIQVWDKQQIHFFVQTDEGKIEKDDTVKNNPEPHVVETDSSGRFDGGGLGYIPFFRLDNGRKQFSGLKPIKALIDDYDLMACSLSNNLQDFTDAIYVVSGFQGHDLDEMIENVKAKKHVGVSENGSLDIKTVDIPYQARETKLNLDEKNIYRFGMGFNSAQLGDGNITNIVIKSRYALLDLKCNKLQIRLKQFFRKLLVIVLDEINKANGTDYQMKDVYFEFDREVMTNAQDNAQIEQLDAQKQGILLDNILKVNNIIDEETIVQIICDILDIDYEEIKDKLPSEQDVETVQNDLNNIVPDDEGGEDIEQQAESGAAGTA
ncbi:MAG: phage portal protein [Anaerostipes sp.]